MSKYSEKISQMFSENNFNTNIIKYLKTAVRGKCKRDDLEAAVYNIAKWFQYNCYFYHPISDEEIQYYFSYYSESEILHLLKLKAFI